MKAARFYLFVLMIYVVSNHQSVEGGILSFLKPIEDGLDIVKKGVGIVNDIKKLFSSPTHEIDDLMGEMLDVSHQIEDVEQPLQVQIADGFVNLQQQLQTQADRSVQLLQQLHTQAELSNPLRDLNNQMGKINRKYNLLKSYANRTMAYENFTLNNFASTCLSHEDDGVPATLDKLHSLIKPDRHGFGNLNLLKLIGEDLKRKIYTHCSDKQSHQYLLYNLLDLVMIAEIKGLALMQFSYTFLRLYGQGNFTTESQLTQNRYQTRLGETLDAFRTAMSIASPDVWRCDPPEWKSESRFDPSTIYVGGRPPSNYIDQLLPLHNHYNAGKSVADITSNKVITGIRFVDIDHTIYLQIEQGELLGDGMIANNTEWVDTDVDDNYVMQRTMESISRQIKHMNEFPVGNIELDEITAPPGHCLTGVRFAKVDWYLRLEIRTTPFNFTTGKLIEPLTRSRWLGTNHTTPRTRVMLTRPDTMDRTISKLQSIPNFGINKYIEFEKFWPNLELGDAFVVPFIDAQPVLPSPRVALAGAGFYYKGRDGYDGFVAPKLKTYNFTNHLGTD